MLGDIMKKLFYFLILGFCCLFVRDGYAFCSSCTPDMDDPEAQYIVQEVMRVICSGAVQADAEKIFKKQKQSFQDFAHKLLSRCNFTQKQLERLRKIVDYSQKIFAQADQMVKLNLEKEKAHNDALIQEFQQEIQEGKLRVEGSAISIISSNSKKDEFERLSKIRKKITDEPRFKKLKKWEADKKDLTRLLVPLWVKLMRLLTNEELKYRNNESNMIDPLMKLGCTICCHSFDAIGQILNEGIKIAQQ